MARTTEVHVIAGEVVDQIRDFAAALETAQTIVNAEVELLTIDPTITVGLAVVSGDLVSWRVTTAKSTPRGVYVARVLATTNVGEVIGHIVNYRVTP